MISLFLKGIGGDEALDPPVLSLVLLSGGEEEEGEGPAAAVKRPSNAFAAPSRSSMLLLFLFTADGGDGVVSQLADIKVGAALLPLAWLAFVVVLFASVESVDLPVGKT